MIVLYVYVRTDLFQSHLQPARRARSYFEKLLILFVKKNAWHELRHIRTTGKYLNILIKAPRPFKVIVRLRTSILEPYL